MQSTDTLTTEEVAASAYRTFVFAQSGVPEWDHLSFEAQVIWVRLAKSAEALLQGMEGFPYADVGLALHRHLYPDGPQPDRRTSLAWEAVARHLTTLLDAEDIPSLESLERSWGSWADKRWSPT